MNTTSRHLRISISNAMLIQLQHQQVSFNQHLHHNHVCSRPAGCKGATTTEEGKDGDEEADAKGEVAGQVMLNVKIYHENMNLPSSPC